MKEIQPRPVIFDCDPGIDDSLALMYLAALHHAGEIDLVAVTTTAGNVAVEDTAANAAWVLELCGVTDVPVAAGEPGPVQVPLTITPETHGPTGLGYATAPQWRSTADWQQLWGEVFARHPGAHLIVTGPMTNLDAFEQVHGAVPCPVTVMGGAVNYRGNTTPTAEWNFWVDPHAAAGCFARRRGLTGAVPPGVGISEPAGKPITLCSLQVTEQFLMTPQRLDTLQAALGGCALGQQIEDILRFYFEFHQAQDEGYQAQIHDALTVMVALGAVERSTIKTTIAVEAGSELMRGTSVADLSHHWGEAHNAEVVTSADMEQAHAELLRAAKILAAQAASV